MMKTMIQSFLQHAPDAPRELTKKLQKIEQSLDTIPEEELEKIDGVVTERSGVSMSETQNPVNLLYEAYSQMEEYAKQNDNDQLHQVINQMRGFYGIPDRYFP